MKDTDHDIDAFEAVMTTLQNMYEVPITKERTHIYFTALKDLPIEMVQTGAARLMRYRTTATFPKPGEIREYALGTKTDIEDMAILAWIDFERGQMRGPYHSVTFENALINDVVVALGGWQSLCRKDMSERSFTRREFLAVYKTLYGSRPKVKHLAGIHETLNGHQPILMLKCHSGPTKQGLLQIQEGY